MKGKADTDAARYGRNTLTMGKAALRSLQKGRDKAESPGRKREAFL